MGRVIAACFFLLCCLSWQIHAQTAGYSVTVGVQWKIAPNDGTDNPYYIGEPVDPTMQTRAYNQARDDFVADVRLVLNCATCTVAITSASPDYNNERMSISFSITGLNATAAMRKFDQEYEGMGYEDPYGPFTQTLVFGALKHCSLLPDEPTGELYGHLCPKDATDAGTGGQGSNGTTPHTCNAPLTMIETGCSALAKNEVRAAIALSSKALLLGAGSEALVANIITALKTALGNPTKRVYLHAVRSDPDADSDDDYPYNYLVIVDFKLGAAGTPTPTELFNSAVSAKKTAFTTITDIKVTDVKVHVEDTYVVDDNNSASAVAPSLAIVLATLAALLF